MSDGLPAHPEGWKVAVRSGSAAYEAGVLEHWNERGWKFAVSAGYQTAPSSSII